MPSFAAHAARAYRFAAAMASEIPVELEPYRDDIEAASPDSPLLTPIQTQPRWLVESSSSATARIKRHVSSVARSVEESPWQTKFLIAILCITVFYILTCLIRRSPLFASNLPTTTTGPYSVGAVDIEYALKEPRRTSDTVFSATGRPAFELETVLFTIYYPITPGTTTNVHHPWIAKPLSVTAHGYASFAHLNNFIFRPIFTFFLWIITAPVSIPAQVDAPLAPPPTAAERDTFPVTIFSHGMASSKTDYTAYLSELASHGHIVAAVEHRDGSCPGTVIRQLNQPDRILLHFKESDLGGIETLQLKKEQLNFREAEVLETYNVLKSLHLGNGDDIRANNPLKEGACLPGFANRLDFGNLTMAGHSYGATLAMQALANPIFRSGVILDAGKESGRLNEDINTPILVVNSESWSSKPAIFFGKPHFSVVRNITLKALNNTGIAWFLTSKGTAHPSVSDAPLLEPILLSLITGSRWDTKAAIRNYANVTLEFLEHIDTGKTAGILAEKVTHEEYGHWVSPARKREFPKDLGYLWQVHVSPSSSTTELA